MNILLKHHSVSAIFNSVNLNIADKSIVWTQDQVLKSFFTVVVVKLTILYYLYSLIYF
jgi:hypothetical protein